MYQSYPKVFVTYFSIVCLSTLEMHTTTNDCGTRRSQTLYLSLRASVLLTPYPSTLTHYPRPEKTNVASRHTYLTVPESSKRGNLFCCTDHFTFCKHPCTPPIVIDRNGGFSFTASPLPSPRDLLRRPPPQPPPPAPATEPANVTPCATFFHTLPGAAPTAGNPFSMMDENDPPTLSLPLFLAPCRTGASGRSSKEIPVVLKDVLYLGGGGGGRGVKGKGGGAGGNTSLSICRQA